MIDMSVPIFATHDTMPRPGVHLVGDGVDVAVVAPHASAVDFCVIDADGEGWSERRVALTRYDWGVWSGHVRDVTAGQRYGFRADGPWEPEQGHRYNPAKLLVDPYARGIAGTYVESAATRGHVAELTPDGQCVGDVYGPADDRDSIDVVPHSVVLAATAAPPMAVSHPGTPWRDTVIYEAHVKGLTRLRTDIPEELRGTYAGIGHDATVSHLKRLGITALELLPIHSHLPESHLINGGLTNYWGYNTLGFFAPHGAYATKRAQDAGPQAVLDEVRQMVASLHAAGIEVILDVVYNHTCEGGLPGPHLSWRGLDNTLYYLSDGGTPRGYADVTGTGNSLDFRRPWVIQLALDSLRYWVTEVGVDGFRFDLAVTLGRGVDGYSAFHPFLVAAQTDPVLQHVKLIAEPWDVGPGGWRTGQFPAPFAEWNDRFRDAVRTFWLADLGAASRNSPSGGVRELATRLSGSADFFGHSDPLLLRGPVASVNYVTAHDGFTAADLVCYDHKHNLANLEDNRDGSNNNLSWNHGIEGPVRESVIGADLIDLRQRSIRNLLGTLILSTGTPMLTAGDEFARTQGGNNNAYCQDNEISWVNWEMDERRRDLLETTRYLLAIRRTYSTLRSDSFYIGAPRPEDAPHQPDLTWFDADGNQVSHAQWHDAGFRTLQMLRRGVGGDAHVLMVVHGELNPREVRLAGRNNTERNWDLLWDSSWHNPAELGVLAEDGPDRELPTGTTVIVEPFSIQVYVARLPYRDRLPLVEWPPDELVSEDTARLDGQ